MIKALLLAMPDVVPQFKIASCLPNLGIVSIAGNIDASICEIKVADLILAGQNPESYALSVLRKQSPDVVGLSCMSFQYHSAIRLAKLIKGYDKNILVVIGGYHPTLMYEEISSPDARFVDFIVRGEGEATFSEFITALNSGSGYDKIEGLSYKVNDRFYHNPPRALLSLDDIKIPKRDARLLKKGFHAFGSPSDAIETSRGCVYSCKFCTIRYMYGKSFREYKVERVISDIKDAREHGAKSLIFADDNITLNLKRLETICDEIISAKLNSMHYFIQASVSGIAHDEKLVRKMADAGVKAVFLGIESLDKKELDFLGKKTSNLENTQKALKYLRDNGIVSLGGFIVGNPEDDEESLWRIFKSAWDMQIDIPIFFILIPHLKTEIRDELMEKQLVTNSDDFSTYNGFYANVRTNYLSSEELYKIVEKMYNTYQRNIGYLKFNQLRKAYPAYFWKLLIKESFSIVSKFIGRK